MYSPAEITAFKNYCQQIIDRPRAIDQQPHERKDGFLFCEDWQIIEMLKYYFNGPVMYADDPPPNRLKRNPLFNKADLVTLAMAVEAEYPDVNDRINYFRSRRSIVYGP